MREIYGADELKRLPEWHHGSAPRHSEQSPVVSFLSAPTPHSYIALQRTVGNRAARSLLNLQRCGAIPSTECPCHTAANSEDGEREEDGGLSAQRSSDNVAKTLVVQAPRAARSIVSNLSASIEQRVTEASSSKPVTEVIAAPSPAFKSRPKGYVAEAEIVQRNGGVVAAPSSPLSVPELPPLWELRALWAQGAERAAGALTGTAAAAAGVGVLAGASALAGAAALAAMIIRAERSAHNDRDLAVRAQQHLFNYCVAFARAVQGLPMQPTDLPGGTDAADLGRRDGTIARQAPNHFATRGRESYSEAFTGVVSGVYESSRARLSGESTMRHLQLVTAIEAVSPGGSAYIAWRGDTLVEPDGGQAVNNISNDADLEEHERQYDQLIQDVRAHPAVRQNGRCRELFNEIRRLYNIVRSSRLRGDLNEWLERIQDLHNVAVALAQCIDDNTPEGGGGGGLPHQQAA